MQGHDILFDHDNQRLGFAESSCDWTGVPSPATATEVREEDCVLGVGQLTESCLDSVLSSTNCSEVGPNPDYFAWGTETSVRPVLSPGTSTGLSCEEVSLAGLGWYPGESSVTCLEEECAEKNRCKVTCKEIYEGGKGTAVVVFDEACDSLWGECAAPSRMSACHPWKDGCLEPPRPSPCIQRRSAGCSKEKERPCSTGACALASCAVPFRVHVSVGFVGGDAQKWSVQQVENFAEAAAGLLDVLPGDIEIMAPDEWTQGQRVAVGDKVDGMKLHFLISVYEHWAWDDKNCEDQKVLQKLSDDSQRIEDVINDPAFVTQLVNALRFKIPHIPSVSSSFSEVVTEGGASKVLEIWTSKAEFVNRKDSITLARVSITILALLATLFLAVLLGYFAKARFWINSQIKYSALDAGVEMYELGNMDETKARVLPLENDDGVDFTLS